MLKVLGSPALLRIPRKAAWQSLQARIAVQVLPSHVLFLKIRIFDFRLSSNRNVPLIMIKRYLDS